MTIYMWIICCVAAALVLLLAWPWLRAQWEADNEIEREMYERYAAALRADTEAYREWSRLNSLREYACTAYAYPSDGTGWEWSSISQMSEAELHAIIEESRAAGWSEEWHWSRRSL